MTPLVVDPSGYLKPHHSVGHCPWCCKCGRLSYVHNSYARMINEH